MQIMINDTNIFNNFNHTKEQIDGILLLSIRKRVAVVPAQSLHYIVSL